MRHGPEPRLPAIPRSAGCGRWQGTRLRSTCRLRRNGNTPIVQGRRSCTTSAATRSPRKPSMKLPGTGTIRRPRTVSWTNTNMAVRMAWGRNARTPGASTTWLAASTSSAWTTMRKTPIIRTARMSLIRSDPPKARCGTLLVAAIGDTSRAADVLRSHTRRIRPHIRNRVAQITQGSGTGSASWRRSGRRRRGPSRPRMA